MKLGKALLSAALVALSLSLGAAMVGPGEAYAKSRSCRQIESQLAAHGSGGGSSQARKYDAAISRQREQLAIARRQARSAGCGFAIVGRSVRQCASIGATIDRMGQNLDDLQDQRSRMGGGKGRDRSRLLAALESAGCNDEEVAVRRPKEELRKALTEEPRIAPSEPDAERQAETQRKVRIEVNPPRARRDEAEAAPDDEASVDPVETFRTMCVRTCDGYFFPMSYASTVGDFERDQKNCETSCPGTDMQVFYGTTGDENAATMISTRNGAPYSALPTAFLHQKTSSPRPASCGCNAGKTFEVIAGTAPVQDTSVEETPAAETDDGATMPGPAAVPLPTARPDTGQAAVSSADPKAATEQAPVSGAAQPSAPSVAPESQSIVTIEPPAPVVPVAPERSEAAKAIDSNPASTEPAPDRKIRVVGPEFLPDLQGAIDLRSPAQKAVR